MKNRLLILLLPFLLCTVSCVDDSQNNSSISKPSSVTTINAATTAATSQVTSATSTTTSSSSQSQTTSSATSSQVIHAHSYDNEGYCSCGLFLYEGKIRFTQTFPVSISLPATNTTTVITQAKPLSPYEGNIKLELTCHLSYKYSSTSPGKFKVKVASDGIALTVVSVTTSGSYEVNEVFKQKVSLNSFDESDIEKGLDITFINIS